MGAFLDKPKTDKTNDIGEGPGFRYVVASMQGWRIDMEDAHHVQIAIRNEPPFDNWSFFAVFDGHAGSKVAFHSAENLLLTLLDTPEFKKVVEELKASEGKMTENAKELIKEGMRTGFLKLDDTMKASHGDDRERSGTTAISAILTPDHIFFANLGDSRGLCSRKSNKTFSTEDHKPYLEKERERIVKAGGSVMIQRVNGSLAVSRALGDFEYKSVPGLCATEQLVSPEPDVYIIDRSKEDDEFLVLACDGIYDVLENDELCSLIRSRLSVTRDLKTAMNQVLDVCLSKGSRDNMTLILVLFDNSPKINEELVEKEKEWLEKVENKIHELLETHDEQDSPEIDADMLTAMLRNEGLDDSPLPGGIHLARSKIDEILQSREGRSSSRS
ncbi:Protein phosphatase 2C containing protein [Aphelenchoides avenae]|nr:Protein phosphatase 2C containing protein [Aphelenchus avenae]KAH7730673.1 Protein phosphatase 2C containing protein [Aphelenchus avenae]